MIKIKDSTFKYLTKKEYNEIPPKWFSEFLELYKADREENNKRWEEQMLFNKNHTHDK